MSLYGVGHPHAMHTIISVISVCKHFYNLICSILFFIEIKWNGKGNTAIVKCEWNLNGLHSFEPLFFIHFFLLVGFFFCFYFRSLLHSFEKMDSTIRTKALQFRWDVLKLYFVFFSAFKCFFSKKNVR